MKILLQAVLQLLAAKLIVAMFNAEARRRCSALHFQSCGTSSVHITAHPVSSTVGCQLSKHLGPEGCSDKCNVRITEVTSLHPSDNE